ncbi:tRNA (adenosine(37)-N6)-threonylcarbamoyltransferase complex ATPase subunit type 1 TsaE [Palleronia caenipelagi]|uniref:tRNA threonylcarbamoyladenosine biosynthesis protein TsaE n=1 Tax=Palleronia caenipelagi TaxID=2489174 RepID=A0A547Q6P0_9RHOB|nr:tRNA (adenosine(37)-N6)-threonylcarbamoyltransferase complex ATPase subunit type 1 TsaE [Palleronia caenipelagi]TRD22048.1 tRNA (adenosine(37)-N6)-threonylcarbamoyltransferase complex ATPase subunit type 1 TsaE [Palleronia caenipelagi]
MANVTFSLPDPSATDRLAQALAPMLEACDTLLLTGDLGAGKSHLARAIIQSLQEPHGPVEDVPSPTYTLVQTYRAGPLEVLHADLYRLGDPSELPELGIEEALGEAVCLIEWPERGEGWPDSALKLVLTPAGDGRIVTLTGQDDHWADRLAHLEQQHV